MRLGRKPEEERKDCVRPCKPQQRTFFVSALRKIGRRWRHLGDRIRFRFKSSNMATVLRKIIETKVEAGKPVRRELEIIQGNDGGAWTPGVASG